MAGVDAEFTNTVANRPLIAEVPVLDALNPREDEGLRTLVTQSVKPLLEDFGIGDFRYCIVFDRGQLFQGIRRISGKPEQTHPMGDGDSA